MVINKKVRFLMVEKGINSITELAKLSNCTFFSTRRMICHGKGQMSCFLALKKVLGKELEPEDLKDTREFSSPLED